jgi:hypothetical protein
VTAPVTATTVQANGNLVGGVTAARFIGLVPAITGPTAGTWLAGDYGVDVKGRMVACTAGGTPGTWVAVGAGGMVPGGYVTVTANQGPALPPWDITNLARTVVLITGRVYRITARAILTSSVATDAIQMAIVEDATDIMLVNEVSPPAGGTSGSNRGDVVRRCPTDVAAGSHTYKGSARRNGTGSGNFSNTAAVGYASWMLVEDIGPL